MLVGCGIVPHGSIILKPKEEGSKEEILHFAMKDFAYEIKNISPDVIFLITPHGIQLSEHYGLYYNTNAEGSAEWLNEYAEFNVKINKINLHLTDNLLQFLKKEHLPVEKIRAFSEPYSIMLRWGEVVPLWFLQEEQRDYMIMSIPFKRYSALLSMLTELTSLGEKIFDFFENITQKVFILISGDLAHTHDENGPYGYSNKAENFDLLIETWIKNVNKKSLGENATKQVNEALSCGFAGFIILQAILKNKPFKSHLYARETPSYYGMAIASFTL